MDRVRYIDMFGKVSEDIYVVDGEPTNKHIVTIINEIDQSQKHKIHTERIVDANVKERLVAFPIDGSLHAYCPKCQAILPTQIIDDRHYIICPCFTNKEFVLVLNSGVSLITNPIVNKEMSMTENTLDQVATIDLAQIKSYGLELWQRTNVNFDHPKIAVVAYALLADEPARKLCFQTYNGKLGKSNNGIAEYGMPELQANQPHALKEKQVGHLLKHGLDKERDKLVKAGYILVD